MMAASKIRFAFVLALMFLVMPLASLAQDVEEPDLNDPAVKQGYREGMKDSTRARFASGDQDFVYVEDSEFLNDTAYVPPVKKPKLAGWLSFAIPGAGQVYNGQYWKIPIIYGGIGSLVYVSQFYNVRYRQMRHDERYFLKMSGKDIEFEGESFFGLKNESDIVRYMNRYRRYRDLCYVGVGLVYLMNIFDAVVDAHLYDYNVTDDIALRVEPFGSAPVMADQRPALGARLVLRF